MQKLTAKNALTLSAAVTVCLWISLFLCPAKDYAAFRTGVKVRHPKFGEGLIISTRGEGSAKVANVSFPGLGIKTLSLQIAPLTVIG